MNPFKKIIFLVLILSLGACTHDSLVSPKDPNLIKVLLNCQPSEKSNILAIFTQKESHVNRFIYKIINEEPIIQNATLKSLSGAAASSYRFSLSGLKDYHELELPLQLGDTMFLTLIDQDLNRDQMTVWNDGGKTSFSYCTQPSASIQVTVYSSGGFWLDDATVHFAPIEDLGDTLNGDSLYKYYQSHEIGNEVLRYTTGTAEIISFNPLSENVQTLSISGVVASSSLVAYKHYFTWISHPHYSTTNYKNADQISRFIHLGKNVIHKDFFILP